MQFLRSVERLLLSIVFQKFDLTEIMMMVGAFLVGEVKKSRRRGGPILQKSSRVATFGSKEVFTASMQYGGTSENILSETFLVESQCTA